MQVSRQIKKVKDIVYELLGKYPTYRDSDEKLSAHIWSTQVGGMEALSKVSAFEFLKEYSCPDTKLYSQESIGRARRKIQELYPELRGELYLKKKSEESEVIGVIRDINDSSAKVHKSE